MANVTTPLTRPFSWSRPEAATAELEAAKKAAGCEALVEDAARVALATKPER